MGVTGSVLALFVPFLLLGVAGAALRDQDRSGCCSAVLMVGIFSRRTNQTQEARVYSHDGPIRRRKRGYIITMDQSDTLSAGIFP
eukprot:5147621-Pyramimonas_sp.AAC.1